MITIENIIVNGVEYCPVTPVVKVDEWKLPEYKDGSKFIAHPVSGAWSESTSGYTKAGRRRATRGLANRCAKDSKTRDLLEAYRDHIDPAWKDECPGSVYYIYINDKPEYNMGNNHVNRIMGTVYGSEKTMRKITDALNAGEISL